MAQQTESTMMPSTAAAASSETVNANLEELQETVSRLSSHKGVEAVIILNRDGDILAESSSSSLIVASGSSQQQQQQEQEGNGASAGVFDADSSSGAAAATAGSGASTATTARSVNQLLRTTTAYIKSLSPDDEVSFLQIRTQQHRELYISPHDGYVLAVVKR